MTSLGDLTVFKSDGVGVKEDDMGVKGNVVWPDPFSQRRRKVAPLEPGWSNLSVARLCWTRSGPLGMISMRTDEDWNEVSGHMIDVMISRTRVFHNSASPSLGKVEETEKPKATWEFSARCLARHVQFIRQHQGCSNTNPVPLSD